MLGVLGNLQKALRTATRRDSKAVEPICISFEHHAETHSLVARSCCNTCINANTTIRRFAHDEYHFAIPCAV